MRMEKPNSLHVGIWSCSFCQCTYNELFTQQSGSEDSHRQGGSLRYYHLACSTPTNSWTEQVKWCRSIMVHITCRDSSYDVPVTLWVFIRSGRDCSTSSWSVGTAFLHNVQAVQTSAKWSITRYSRLTGLDSLIYVRLRNGVEIGRQPTSWSTMQVTWSSDRLSMIVGVYDNKHG